LYYIFVADNKGYLQPFYVISARTTEFGKITQNNGHYVSQRHSRSSILVPIESP